MKTSLYCGSDSTTDVLIHCSNGVIPTHRLVLASISSMLSSILKQDSWDEPISVLLKDFTVEELSEYFQDFYQNGFQNVKDSILMSTLGIHNSFLSCHRDLERILPKTQNHFESKIIKNDFKEEDFDNFLGVDHFFEDNGDDGDDDYDMDKNRQKRNKENRKNGKAFSIKEIKKPRKKLKQGLLKEENLVVEENVSLSDDVKNAASNRSKTSEAWEYFEAEADNSGYVCKLCSTKLLGKKNDKLRDHLRYKHTEIFMTLRTRKCGKVIKHEQKKFGQYYSEIPDNPAKYNCNLCNSAITRVNIMRHIQNKHKIYENGVPPKKHLCSFCGNTFRDKYDKDKHEYLHHKQSLPEGVESKFDNKSYLKKEFFCSDCGRKFTTKGNMNMHSCEGREGTLECPENGCTLKFYNKLMLEKHIQSCYLFKNCREAVNTLTCTKCNIKFPNFKNMKQHCLQSTTCTLIEKKPFQCNVCNKFFTTEKRFTLHMRVHTGETPFQCNLCLKKFKFNFKLTTHKCIQ